MKPIKLTIEGLNSFVEKQELDFSRLGESSIFGIFGQTGSGKSTILDAISLALFGNIERSKSNLDFVNLKTKFTKIEFWFEYTEKNNTKLIKVLREYRISKSNDVTQKAQVFDCTKKDETMLMEGPTKVDLYLKELIGLNQNEFSKCVALPQGEFAGFLKAKPNERINIIGGIFDLNKYGEQLWEKARNKVNKTQGELSVVKSKIEMLGDISEELKLKRIEEFKQLEKNITENKELIAKSTEALGKERDLAKAGKQLDEVESVLKNLALNGVDIADKKQKVSKAKAIKVNAVSIETVETLSKRVLEEGQEVDSLNLKLDKEEENARKVIAQNNIQIENLKVENARMTERKEALKQASVVSEKLDELQKSQAELMEKLSELDLAKTESVQEKEENEKRLKLLNDEYAEKKRLISDLEGKLVNYYDVTSYNFFVKEQSEVENYLKYVNLLVEGAINLKANASDKVNEITKEINNKKSELVKLRKEALGKTKLDTESKVPILVDAINNLVILLSKLNTTEEYIKNLVERENEYHRENQIRTKKIEIAQASIDKERFTLSDTDSKIEKLNSTIESLEKQRLDAITNNSVAEFTSKYKVGDNCPICNNEILTKNVLAELDVLVIEKDLKENKNQLKIEAKNRERSLEIISKLAQEIEGQNEEINFNNESINAIVLEINSKCTNLLNKKKAKPSDISVVQLQVKEDIVRLEEKRKVELELISNLNELIEEKSKYSSILVTSGGKVDDYNELKKSVEKFKTRIDDEVEFITKGQDIEQRIKELGSLQAQKKDAEVNANQLHNKIVEINEVIKTIAENHSSISAEASIKQKTLSELNVQIKQTKEQFVGYEEIKSFAKEINGLEVKIQKNEKEINLNTINIDKLDNLVAGIKAEILNKNTILKEHRHLRNSTLDSLMIELNKVGIENFDDLYSYKMEDAEVESIEKFVNEYDGNVSVLLKQKDELEKTIGGKIIDVTLIANIEATLENTTAVMNQRIEESGRLKSEIDVLTEKLKTLAELKDLENALTGEYNIQSELCDTLRGKALVEFVAEEFMDDITYMASEKLVDLMDGRYTLKYENKDFVVIDNFNNGEERSSRTLSGGELFVVSLALALSISESLMSKSDKRLDFFFLDEGFGTLDKEYCEYIVTALNKLANKNMTIGLISHIPELQERIKKKFVVTKASNERGSIVKLVKEV